jgi:hypothetical protein
MKRLDPTWKSDPELLSERRQLNINIECGPGSAARTEINRRLEEIDTELRRRSHYISEAEARIALARKAGGR